MADYGLRVLSASLDVQIDGTYRNYALVKNGSEPRTGGGLPWLIATFPQVSTDEMPFVTVKAQTATLLNVIGIDNTPPVASLNRVFVEFPLNSNLVCYYQVFKPGIFKYPDYGLIVKNTIGSTVFSSEDKHLHPIDGYEATLGYGNKTASVDVTVEDADNSYFALYPPVERRELTAPSTDRIFTKRGFKKVDSTTIRVQNFTYQTGPVLTGAGVAWAATFNLLEFRKE